MLVDARNSRGTPKLAQPLVPDLRTLIGNAAQQDPKVVNPLKWSGSKLSILLSGQGLSKRWERRPPFLGVLRVRAGLDRDAVIELTSGTSQSKSGTSVNSNSGKRGLTSAFVPALLDKHYDIK